MRRQFLTAIVAVFLAVVADSGEAFACFFRRRRRRTYVPPQDGQKSVKTVENLATFLIQLKNEINRAVPNEVDRTNIDRKLGEIMGEPNELLRILGPKVITDGERVSRDDIADDFDNEVLDISKELKRLAAGS